MSITMERNSSRRFTPSVVLVLVMTLLGAECRPPPPPNQEFDPVDLCILNCDYCFKGEALVKCANECITQDGTVGPIWVHTCRHFVPGFSRGRN